MAYIYCIILALCLLNSIAWSYTNCGTSLKEVSRCHFTSDNSMQYGRCEFDVNVTDSCGTTPLMDAARASHVDMISLLVDQFQVSNKAVFFHIEKLCKFCKKLFEI